MNKEEIQDPELVFKLTLEQIKINTTHNNKVTYGFRLISYSYHLLDNTMGNLKTYCGLQEFEGITEELSDLDLLRKVVSMESESFNEFMLDIATSHRDININGTFYPNRDIHNILWNNE